MDTAAREQRLHILLDAIELLQAERRAEAVTLLRGLIQQDSDFEEAWLWMSIAVDSLDQSAVCLDNVLRINPHNAAAASALLRLRQPEMAFDEQRRRLRLWRDVAFTLLWLLVVGLLYVLLFTFMGAGRG